MPVWVACGTSCQAVQPSLSLTLLGTVLLVTGILLICLLGRGRPISVTREPPMMGT